MDQLISIIIPTYNRAHLIGETLKSVGAQTYSQWECIVVDDGSTDGTDVLVSAFAKADPRIQYHHRPAQRPKGANACRNYGFELSKGAYIIWFDSDDQFKEQALEKHLAAIKNTDHLYSVSKFENLQDDQISPEPLFLQNKQSSIDPKAFLKQEIFFGTINVLLQRQLVANTRWNESLKSGQEYHFFSNVLIPNRATGAYLDEALSIRCIHDASIQTLQNKNMLAYLENKLHCYYQTLVDLQDDLEPDEARFLVNHCLSFYFRLMRFKKLHYNKQLLRFVLSYLSDRKQRTYKTALLLNRYLGKGHQLYKKSTL